MNPREKVELICSVIKWYMSECMAITLTDAQVDIWASRYISNNLLPTPDDSLPPYDTNSG